MSTPDQTTHLSYAEKRRQGFTLGMGLFITAEAMFFAGLIGSYLVLKAIHTAPDQQALQQNVLLWLCGSVGRTPPDQNFWLPDSIQLPMFITTVNTLLLVISTYLIYRGTNLAKKEQWKQAQRWFLGTLILGLVFLIIQGSEWSRMLAHGLTIGTKEGSIFAGLFYTIIAVHGIHVLGGISYLLYCIVQFLYQQQSTTNYVYLKTCRNYWFFVCLLWPLLFGLLYFE